MSEEQTKHLVIIGCSHAGLGLIDKLRGKLPQGWKVTVVEPNTHFHWQIGSVRAVVDQKFAESTLIGPLSQKFSKLGADFELVQDRVTSVDTEAKTVHLKNGATLPYIYLVVASGSKSAFPWKTNVDKEDPIQDLKDTFKLYSEAIKNADNIIIGGAGAVGLEVAGEIVDMYKDKKVTVVDANAALLPEELGWYRSVGDRFEGLLKKAGVKVLHGTRVTSPQASSPVPVEVTLSDGTSETGLYLAATGVKPQAGFLPASLLTEKGFVDTTPTLQAKQDAHIFAVGDASNNERKLALVINNQLPVLSHNLIQLMANDGASASLQQYGGDTRTLMGLITFGKGAGGGQVGPIRFPSFMVAWIKGKDMFASKALALVQ